MPKVLNKLHDPIPSSAVYIGRPSPYGNPYIIGKDGSRKEVIEKYRLWVHSQPVLLEKIKSELRDKDLVCFCSPKACHGDVIMDILYNSLFD